MISNSGLVQDQLSAKYNIFAFALIVANVALVPGMTVG